MAVDSRGCYNKTTLVVSILLILILETLWFQSTFRLHMVRYVHSHRVTDSAVLSLARGAPGEHVFWERGLLSLWGHCIATVWKHTSFRAWLRAMGEAESAPDRSPGLAPACCPSQDGSRNSSVLHDCFDCKTAFVSILWDVRCFWNIVRRVDSYAGRRAGTHAQ